MKIGHIGHRQPTPMLGNHPCQIWREKNERHVYHRRSYLHIYNLNYYAYIMDVQRLSILANWPSIIKSYMAKKNLWCEDSNEGWLLENATTVTRCLLQATKRGQLGSLNGIDSKHGSQTKFLTPIGGQIQLHPCGRCGVT